MDIVLKVKPSELNEELLKKLKSFVGSEEYSISIRLSNNPETISHVSESREEYFTRLQQSIDDVNNKRNVTEFSLDEFDAFSKALLGERGS